MPLVTCPQCAYTAEFDGFVKSADEFCPTCDFPLFWAGAVRPDDGDADDDSYRRLPGADGKKTIGTRSCPACSELNPTSATVCLRCGASLEPKPFVPPTPRPMPPMRDLPALVEDPPTWPLWVAVGVLVVVLLVLLGVWIW
jgi:ribosomal protein L40E